VQVEARRVEKLLAYQRAYDEAWQRLNPGMQRVNLPDDKPSAGIARGSGRMAVFVKDGCTACGQLVQRLQSSGAEFDLYMVGSRQDDAASATGPSARRSTRRACAPAASRSTTTVAAGCRWACPAICPPPCAK
jgi:hypothetical protein